MTEKLKIVYVDGVKQKPSKKVKLRDKLTQREINELIKKNRAKK